MKQDSTISDRKMAEQFLKLLDPKATAWTFQTFDDNADRKDGNLAAVFNGSLSECYADLAAKSAAGAGVFVTVNQTDLAGRKLGNITGVRALWREKDRQGLSDLPLAPHIINASSPGKFHEYILVKDAPLDEFEAVQMRLVDDWGSDPNAKDRSRVLRLPGFPHQKVSKKKGLTGEQFMVNTVQSSGADPISWNEVVKIFPPVIIDPVKKKTRRKRSAGLQATAKNGDGIILKVAEVWSALQHIEADCEYDEWLRVGMVLHDESDGGADGLKVWDFWSKRGADYKEGECDYRWETFGRYDGQPVALGALFKMAYNRAWNGKIPESADGVALANKQHKRQLAHFNTLHASVMVECKSLIMYREYDQNIQAMVTRAVSSAAMKDYLNPYQIPEGKTIKTEEGTEYIITWKPIFPQWLHMRARRTYSQVAFKPKGGMVSGGHVLPDGKYLNLYQGLALTPVKGDCQLILEHIYYVLADENNEIFHFLMCWLARMFQHPGEQGHLMVVLRSGQGTGKNIIIDLIRDYFGDHAAFCTHPDDITGRFTDHLATSVVVILNEAVWGGDKKHEGVLKSLITDDMIPLEKKFLPRFRVPNCTHILVLTNNDWAVPVDMDDRRTVLLDVSERYKDNTRENEEYFEKLAACISNGGKEAFLHTLMTWDISGFHPRRLPESVSASKIDHKVRTMDAPTVFWFECLHAGQIMGEVLKAIGNKEIGNVVPDWDHDSCAWIETQTLDAAFRTWATGHGYGNTRVTQTSLVQKLKDLSGMKRVRAGTGERPWGYEIPSLKQCKEKMEQKLKHRVPDWWDDENET